MYVCLYKKFGFFICIFMCFSLLLVFLFCFVFLFFEGFFVCVNNIVYMDIIFFNIYLLQNYNENLIIYVWIRCCFVTLSVTAPE